MYFVYNKSRRMINELYIAMKVAKHTAVEKIVFLSNCNEMAYRLQSKLDLVYTL